MSSKKVSTGVARICRAHREHLDINVRDGIMAVAKEAIAAGVTVYDQKEAIADYIAHGYTEGTAKVMASVDALIVHHARSGKYAGQRQVAAILDAADKLPANKRFSSRDLANYTTAMRRARDAEYFDENGKPIPAMKRGEYEPATISTAEITAAIEGATKLVAKRTKVAKANREATIERKAFELAMAFINRCKFGPGESKGRDAVISKLEARMAKLTTE